MGALYVLHDDPPKTGPTALEVAIESAPTATMAATKSAAPEPTPAQPELVDTNPKLNASPSPTAAFEPSPSARPRGRRPLDRRVKVKPKKADELFDGSDL